MQVKHLADNLPLPIEFDEIEEVREPMAGPIVSVNANIGACADDIDRADPALDVLGGAIGVIPVKQALNGASKQVGSHVTIDGCTLMECGLHCLAFPVSSAIDVVLQRLCDGIDFFNICGLRHVHSFAMGRRC